MLFNFNLLVVLCCLVQAEPGPLVRLAGAPGWTDPPGTRPGGVWGTAPPGPEAEP